MAKKKSPTNEQVTRCLLKTPLLYNLRDLLSLFFSSVLKDVLPYRLHFWSFHDNKLKKRIKPALSFQWRTFRLILLFFFLKRIALLGGDARCKTSHEGGRSAGKHNVTKSSSPWRKTAVIRHYCEMNAGYIPSIRSSLAAKQNDNPAPHMSLSIGGGWVMLHISTRDPSFSCRLGL